MMQKNMEELINKVFEILITTGQRDMQFRLGDIIRYSPSEIKEILRDHAEELAKVLEQNSSTTP